MQEITLYAVAVISLCAFAAALYSEVEAKALRTRVKMQYASQMPSRLASLLATRAASGRTGTDGKPLRLKLTDAVSKVGCRGNMLLGSLLNSLTTRAVRHGFAKSHVNARRLQLLSDVTHSARQYLDHCQIHSYLSKKAEAVFFRRLVGTVCSEATRHAPPAQPSHATPRGAVQKGPNARLCCAVPRGSGHDVLPR